jgi:hypothetical protein
MLVSFQAFCANERKKQFDFKAVRLLHNVKIAFEASLEPYSSQKLKRKPLSSGLGFYFLILERFVNTTQCMRDNTWIAVRHLNYV